MLTPMSVEHRAREQKPTPGSDEDPSHSDRLLIRRHSEKAWVLTYGSRLAAGYNLYKLGTLDCAVDLKPIRGSAQGRNVSQLGGKP
jgi:hypothetical protein